MCRCLTDLRVGGPHLPVRKLIPCSMIEDSPCFTLSLPAPLFKEERNACTPALVPNPNCPCSVHGAISRPRLTTDDHPMNPSEIEARKGSEKGLQGKEPDVSSGAPQVLSTPKVGGAFYAYAH